MREAAERSPLIIDILVDGTSRTVNDESDSHSTSVVGKILTERVNKDGASYQLLACGHETVLPLDADRAVFYHCGLAADKGKFKGHPITMPAGTSTGATDDGKDEMAFVTYEAVSQYIQRVKRANPTRQVILNFAGYSRGAIVIGHLTNEFAKKYGADDGVTLNRAVGIDPVAGSSSGCLIDNEKKLADHRIKAAAFPPVNTKVWGRVQHLNLYYATEVARAHFQAQTPHGITTHNGRRVLNFDDRTHITVTNIATSHHDIACTRDSDDSHVPFPILILECYLQDKDLPRFGDDQLLDTAMPYRVSMEQIQACLVNHTNLGYREVLSIGFLWKLANLAFTGRHSYVTPLIARAILSTDHPVLHASYQRSVFMDACGFLSDLFRSGVIKEDLHTIALNVDHPQHRFLINCYQRSSYYHASHNVLSANLTDKTAEEIDKILLQGTFIKPCIKQICRSPFSTTKETLAEAGAWNAEQYLKTLKTMSTVIASKAIQLHLIRRLAPGGLWTKPIDLTRLRRPKAEPQASAELCGFTETKAGM
ncbi:MAG: hypothetical protein P1U34_05400 [Coxiellaceae bacterium]|nr:hypothetical protein [Coxiellaceae bacterium]